MGEVVGAKGPTSPLQNLAANKGSVRFPYFPGLIIELGRGWEVKLSSARSDIPNGGE